MTLGTPVLLTEYPKSFIYVPAEPKKPFTQRSSFALQIDYQSNEM